MISNVKTVSSIKYRVYSEEKTKKEMDSQIPSPLEGEGQGEGDNILSREEAAKRFKALRQRLMAMD
ncbi:MAG: hypothetical protein U9N03_06380 [Candidatus Caldatribacteriota bacterium]|nr:hypothetical protein [Candidatus Caldatribacteriota bacterium]